MSKSTVICNECNKACFNVHITSKGRFCSMTCADRKMVSLGAFARPEKDKPTVSINDEILNTWMDEINDQVNSAIDMLRENLARIDSLQEQNREIDNRYYGLLAAVIKNHPDDRKVFNLEEA